LISIPSRLRPLQGPRGARKRVGGRWRRGVNASIVGGSGGVCVQADAEVMMFVVDQLKDVSRKARVCVRGFEVNLPCGPAR
jgi:hypothetical protein